MCARVRETRAAVEQRMAELDWHVCAEVIFSIYRSPQGDPYDQSVVRGRCSPRAP